MASGQFPVRRSKFRRTAFGGLLALGVCLACGPFGQARAGEGRVKIGEPAAPSPITTEQTSRELRVPFVPYVYASDRRTMYFDRWYYVRQLFRMGKYKIAYPLRPDYTDPRDSRVYAAQGAGIPLAVPLAPNVSYGYNYSNGPQGSRMTPISRYQP